MILSGRKRKARTHDSAAGRVFVRRRATLASVAGAFVWGWLAGVGRAERPEFRYTAPPPILDQWPSRGVDAAPADTVQPTTPPEGAYQTPPASATPSSLFRNTRLPYSAEVALPAVYPSARTESVQAHIRVELPALGGGFSLLQQGFDPQDADLKVGPFFFKLRALEGAVLHSDNVNLTEDHRESGTIAIVTLTASIVAQITEGLRLATSGSLVYFPLEGKVGIAGFGLSQQLYNFGVIAGPSTRAQVIWNTEIGGWNVVIADDFQILLGSYSDSIRNDQALFDGGTFSEESRAGRYAFRAPGSNVSGGNQGDRFGLNRQGDREFNGDFVVFSNTISAETDRLLPGTVRLRVQVYHEDLWYNQGNRGLPSLREGATVSLRAERENMRFKPYAIYEAFRTDFAQGFQQIIRLGVAGPITEQLDFRAEAGYYYGGFGQEGGLWLVELRHTAGPYTHESLTYTRSFSYFHDEINEGVEYNIHQVLGPRLSGDAYLARYRVEDLLDDLRTRDEWRAGLRLTLLAGPKTTVRLTGEYALIDPDETEAWTGRVEIGYKFSDTISAQFLYQYQQSSSAFSGFNYTENLFYLSLTKYFE